MPPNLLPWRLKFDPSRSSARAIRAFGRNQEGATAVEFALVAIPFFGLLFVTIQLALVLWTTQMLEAAVATASRELFTGQFQTDPNNALLKASDLRNKFKDKVCKNIVGVFDCPTMVSVDVRSSATVSGLAAPSPNNNGVYDTSGYTFQTPARNEIALVRVSMQFPNYASIFNPTTTLNNGYQLIMANAAFRVEPF
jgi:Flp pilus assembly protein TadG